jgi:hypothetical protein
MVTVNLLHIMFQVHKPSALPDQHPPPIV